MDRGVGGKQKAIKNDGSNIHQENQARECGEHKCAVAGLPQLSYPR